ncbi:MAG TPA: EamA family transporter RarD, partial [Polyangiaceae bacterium]|nr:EamA family transporter RarD [Polyangiaceae bacterium]
MPETPPPPTPEVTPEALRRQGVWLSVAAYTLWGAFPIYFKALHPPPLEVLAHRVVWSALFLLAVLAVQRRVPQLLALLRSPRVILASFASALLLGNNWFVYIWAVAHERVIDASLGYFITPLVSVSLGVLFFREALRPAQRIAIATAALGVAWLTLQFGQLPWVGLALAFSFGSYAAMRKRQRVDAFQGLLLEQVLMLPLAAGYLGYLSAQGQSVFQLGGSAQVLLALLTGPLSAVPLLMFAAGARRIPLSLVGVLQYISPTLQLLFGVLLWHEPFGGTKFVGYALIWLALVIYSLEGVWAAKLRRRE